jgi:UDP-glucose 4-epimerase
MTKSIYITGIAGLIGSSVAKHYLKQGWKVAGCDSLIGGYKENVPKAAYFQHSDIKDLEFLGCENHYDVVFHAAALAHEGFSVFSPSLITNSIYSNTMKIATLAIRYGAKLFINCSSMARYGNIEPPFTEDMMGHPVDPYGLAKLQAEQQLALLADIYPQFKYYTVVPHNVCGAQQVYNDPYRNVLSIMIHQALRDYPIFIYGDGNQTRSFSHVNDCVNAISALIELQPEQKVFNIGPEGNEITINRLAELVKLKTNSKSKIIKLDPRPREVKEAYCSATLSKEILHYQTLKTVDDIIDDIIEFIRLNGFRDYKYNLPIEINDSRVPKTWSKRLFGLPLEEVIRYNNELISS